MAGSETPTDKGKRLINSWVAAQDRLVRAKSEVNGAECDVSNTRNALARWMLPEDVKPGEKIAIWYGDSLIQVEHVGPNYDAIVTVRTRGRKGVTGDFRG